MLYENDELDEHDVVVLVVHEIVVVVEQIEIMVEKVVFEMLL